MSRQNETKKPYDDVDVLEDFVVRNNQQETVDSVLSIYVFEDCSRHGTQEYTASKASTV